MTTETNKYEWQSFADGKLTDNECPKVRSLSEPLSRTGLRAGGRIDNGYCTGSFAHFLNRQSSRHNKWLVTWILQPVYVNLLYSLTGYHIVLNAPFAKLSQSSSFPTLVKDYQRSPFCIRKLFPILWQLHNGLWSIAFYFNLYLRSWYFSMSMNWWLTEDF